MKRKSIFVLILISFSFTSVIQQLPVYADDLILPIPGQMVPLSPPLNPPMLKGLKIDPNNPLKFDFILDVGDNSNVIPAKAGIQNQEQLKIEANKLIKYFLASITVPENDLWVNLSPYEKNRIVPDSFGQTEMGRDLLAEDYMLKQITASLIYPEGETGKKFWQKVYQEAYRRYGTTNFPINTFNKVWIVPEKAVVYENAKAGTAYVLEAKLKVMLEEDYLSMEKHHENTVILSKGPHAGHAQVASKDLNKINSIRDSSAAPQDDINVRHDVASIGANILRQIVIPELTREVNEDKNFAQLRQVYNSLILATWYKKKIKDSILEQVYADKEKIVGVGYDKSVIQENSITQENSVILSETKDLNKFKDSSAAPQNDVDKIYQRYVQAFKKGVFNYIKEGSDPITQETVPRKYFSGGTSFAQLSIQMRESKQIDAAQLNNTHGLFTVLGSFAVTGKLARENFEMIKRGIIAKTIKVVLQSRLDGYQYKATTQFSNFYRHIIQRYLPKAGGIVLDTAAADGQGSLVVAHMDPGTFKVFSSDLLAKVYYIQKEKNWAVFTYSGRQVYSTVEQGPIENELKKEFAEGRFTEVDMSDFKVQEFAAQHPSEFERINLDLDLPLKQQGFADLVLNSDMVMLETEDAIKRDAIVEQLGRLAKDGGYVVVMRNGESWGIWQRQADKLVLMEGDISEDAHYWGGTKNNINLNDRAMKTDSLTRQFEVAAQLGKNWIEVIASRNGRINKGPYEFSIGFKYKGELVRFYKVKSDWYTGGLAVVIFKKDVLTKIGVFYPQRNEFIPLLKRFRTDDKGRFEFEGIRHNLGIDYAGQEIILKPLEYLDWQKGYNVYWNNKQIAVYLTHGNRFILLSEKVKTDESGRFTFAEKRQNLGSFYAGRELVLKPLEGLNWQRGYKVYWNSEQIAVYLAKGNRFIPLLKRVKTEDKGRFGFSKKRHSVGSDYAGQELVLKPLQNLDWQKGYIVYWNNIQLAVYRTLGNRFIRLFEEVKTDEKGRFEYSGKRQYLGSFYARQKLILKPLETLNWHIGYNVYWNNMKIAVYLARSNRFIPLLARVKADDKGRFGFSNKRHNVGSDYAGQELVLKPLENLDWQKGYNVYCNNKQIAVYIAEGDRFIPLFKNAKTDDKGRFELGNNRYRLDSLYSDKRYMLKPFLHLDWQSGIRVFDGNQQIAYYDVKKQKLGGVMRSVRDRAMNSPIVSVANSLKGGIDFTAAKTPLVIQNAGQSLNIHYDPAMIKALQNAAGFVPVNINIQPLKNLRSFLGLNPSVGVDKSV